MADNSLIVLNNIDELTHFRVTSLNRFKECPSRWWAETLGQGKNNTSKAAETGTLVHSVIERYLLYQFELFTPEWNAIQLELDNRKVPAKERTALLHLLQSLTDRRHYLNAVEYEFTLNIIDDALPIKGHIDAIFHNPEGGLSIIDFKTNRQYQGVDYWSNQTQPILYSYAISQIYPSMPPIYFEIIYVNLGTSVIWEVGEDKLQAYKNYIKILYNEVWQEFNVYKRTGEWPERINEYCGFCSRRDNCQLLKNSHTEFLNSFLHTDEKSLAAKFLHARNIRNAVDKQFEELKEQLIEEIQANGGKLEDSEHTFSLRKNRKREVKLIPLWNKLYELVDISGHGLVAEWLNNSTTVKITELDTFLMEYPTFAESVNELIEVKENDSFTLNVISNKKL